MQFESAEEQEAFLSKADHLHKWSGEYQYENLLLDVLQNGVPSNDRTGVGTISLFGTRMEFDLSKAFPLITSKKVFIKGVIYELLWFLRGDTNVRWLQEHGVHIWDEWADANGDLGPVYGCQWRNWPTDLGGIDQIANAIETIREDPHSRRIIVNSWNVESLSRMALPPCHCLFQFHVRGDKLDCQLYQRSCDMFLGVPFNIAEYALLTMMVAQQTGYRPGRFIWVGGDTHIYRNHLEQVVKQLEREPRPYPHMSIDKASSIDAYTYDDFHLTGYDPWPAIKAPVAV